MRFHLLHPRVQLVTIMRRNYQNGMTTLSGGNLSIREDNGDIWITPAGVDKGKLMPRDIMYVRAGGSVEGLHSPSSELPFHRAIYEQRPDLRAVVHAHPPALVSFSTVRQIPDTSIIPQAQRVCGPVGYAPYALPGSERLGQNIAAAFAQGYNVILLENHGTATGGSHLLEAFQRLETLDFCARTLVRGHSLGPISSLSDADLTLFDQRQNLLPEFIPAKHSSQERELRRQIVEILHRACDRYLMISTEGVISTRVDGQSFLITPTGLDRRSVDIEDIVLIHQGKRQQGQAPSRSVGLHETIYQRHPEINSIMTAQSPNAATYAITASHFDTRTIPESYILLRDIPVIRFVQFYQEYRQVAETISLNTPVALAQNDSVLTVGRTVLEAFDRLEVAEYSAKSLIDTAAIGSLVPIEDKEISALKEAYALG